MKFPRIFRGEEDDSEKPTDIIVPESLHIKPNDKVIGVIKRIAKRLSDKRVFGHIVINEEEVRIRAEKILAEIDPNYFHALDGINSSIGRGMALPNEDGPVYVITKNIETDEVLQLTLSDTIRGMTHGRLEAIFS